MGVTSIDEIIRPLKNVLRQLEDGKVNSEIIHLKDKSADNIIYTVRKTITDFEYLSENLKNRGLRDGSLYGRLKQAFNGLFNGF